MKDMAMTPPRFSRLPRDFFLMQERINARLFIEKQYFDLGKNAAETWRFLLTQWPSLRLSGDDAPPSYSTVSLHLKLIRWGNFERALEREPATAPAAGHETPLASGTRPAAPLPELGLTDGEPDMAAAFRAATETHRWRPCE